MGFDGLGTATSAEDLFLVGNLLFRGHASESHYLDKKTKWKLGLQQRFEGLVL